MPPPLPLQRLRLPLLPILAFKPLQPRPPLRLLLQPQPLLQLLLPKLQLTWLPETLLQPMQLLPKLLFRLLLPTLPLQ